MAKVSGLPGRLHLRRASVVVLIGFVTGSVGILITGNRLVRAQEGRLLAERTSEIGALLASAASGLEASLQSLGSVAASSTPEVFAARAKLLTASPQVSAVVLVGRDGDRFVVRSGAGRDLPAGTALDGGRAALLARAGAKLRMDVFPVSPGQSRFAVVLGPPTAPPGTAIYSEYVVNPSAPTPVTRSKPFEEVKIALYVGARADPGKLLIATARPLPLRGLVSQTVVPVGGDKWLVVGSPRRPLVGSLTDGVPRMLMAVVLLVGLAMVSVVETIGRRRDFAEVLVNERTAALRESLDELEGAQAQLVLSERLAALGEMAATVGHELRNPLGAVTNSLYLIRSNTDPDDRLRRQLDTADREVAAATLIVSDLLEFARARAPMPVTVDVDELVSEALTVAPPPQGVHVDRGGERPPPVFADRDQLRQVILNVVSNAYQAMPDGGDLTITTATTDDAAVEVVISDSGVGMDLETQGRIFEPFFTSKTKGTGLGLAVSKRIMEDHAGSISVASEEGAGTAFTLRLPVEFITSGART